MLRTNFENDIIYDAVSWYASTDNVTLKINQNKIKETIHLLTKEDIKHIVNKYWENYFK